MNNDLHSPEDVATGLNPEAIAEKLQIPLLRARQLFQWLHKKRVFDPDSMTDMPKAIRQRLSEPPAFTALKEVEKCVSPKTGTVKLLFQLRDGEVIESVLLRHGVRVTFCLSSQAGCALGCAFCATGISGLSRNLSTSEIVEQALRLAAEAQLPEDVTPNIVFMGMGEPFQNYDAVIRAIRLLMRHDAMSVGARKIIVSTVGDVAGIHRFTEEDWQVRLSVSLHSADNATRSKLVPMNKRYPLDVLHEALSQYQRRTGRQITVEYALLNEVNDSVADARALVAYLKTLDAAVNLIPYNAVTGLDFKAPSREQQSLFLDTIKHKGLNATLRRERGDDIEAACGQLRGRHIRTADSE